MTTELRIPNVGESIQEVQIGKWLKQEGEHVNEDENVVELETEKASLELPSPISGTLKILKPQGATAAIGETIAYLSESEAKASGEPPTAPESGQKSPPAPAPRQEKPQPTSQPAEPKEEKAASRQDPEPPVADRPRTHATPSARRALREHDLAVEDVEVSGKQLRREDVLRHVERQKNHSPKTDASTSPSPAAPKGLIPSSLSSAEGKQTDETTGADEQMVPMTRIRQRIAERLVHAQKTAALLTTYNEVDMTAIIELRKEFGERFRDKYGTKLGFMSFFVKAVVDALKEVPELNAEIRGTNIVYRNRYDIGVAIGSEHGLVVPVLRRADRLSFAEIEQAIGDFAARASARKLQPHELTGGTFTISNGGIYGSLLSTPIVNPPQSGVLGMHAIQERPVAREGQVVIRPMMYLALTYDHRIIDGREAVTWLRRVKDAIEQPSRMLIEV